MGVNMNQNNGSNGVAVAENLAEISIEEENALRWRRAILRLSEAFMDAADERRELSPILLEALHNALDNLLVHGEAGDLMTLEEWLSMESESKDATWRRHRREFDRRGYERRFAERRFAERRHMVTFMETDSRHAEERRAAARRARTDDDRRRSARRAPRDWQFEEIKITGSPS